MPTQRTNYLAAIFVMVACFIAVLFFNFMAGSDIGREIGIFLQTTAEISDRYPVEITPSGWTFSIWGVIYLFQLVWIIYVFSTMCRKGLDGDALYWSPPYTPIWLYVALIFNYLLNIAWIFLFDRELMIYALPVLALIAFTNYIVLFMSFRGLSKYHDVLKDNGYNGDLWAVRILLQNGIGLYATWTSIATLLNMSIVMVYTGGLDQLLVGYISLGILSFELLLWFVLDIGVVSDHTKYFVAPYLVTPFALGGIINKDYGEDKSVEIFCAILCGVASLLAILKFVFLMAKRSAQRGRGVSSNRRLRRVNTADKSVDIDSSEFRMQTY